MKVADLFVDLQLDTSLFSRDLSSAMKTASSKATVTVTPGLDSKRLLSDMKTAVGKVSGQVVGVKTSVDDSAIKALGSSIDSLSNETIRVDADTSKADSAIGGLKGSLTKAGEDGSAGIEGALGGLGSKMPKIGGGLGGALGGGIMEGVAPEVSALSSSGGPIAIALVGLAAVGFAAGKVLWGAIEDGMAQNSAKFDFQAQTGLSKATAAKFGEAAGQTYAENFGDSVAGNLETAKLALQNGLLDPQSTQIQVQQVVSQLSQVTKTLGIDIPEAAKAAGQLMKTGLADNATQAFDIIVAGTQKGLNISDDFLDTLNEYSSQFHQLGLSAPEALGIVSQFMQAGARDSDVAADALKEFFIRVTDGSDATQGALTDIGLPAGKIAEQFAKGGDAAQTAFEKTVRALQSIKDPLEQRQAAIKLFGTQFEDLGININKIDPTQIIKTANATDRLVRVAGSDPAQAIEQAKRSIEQSSNDIKGALATAFAPLIKDVSNWISTHRADILHFFALMTDAGFNIAIAFSKVEGVLQRINQVIATVVGQSLTHLADLTDAAYDAGLAIAKMGGPAAVFAFKALAGGVKGTADQMRVSGEVALKAAEGYGKIADGANASTKALEKTKDRFDKVTAAAEATARVADATRVLGNAVKALGTNADGTQTKFGSLRAATRAFNDASSAQGRELRAVNDAFHEQQKAASAANATDRQQIQLNKDHRAQLQQTFKQMGFNNEQARKLTERYDGIPGTILTKAQWEDSDAKRGTESYKTYVNNQLHNIKDEPVAINLSAQAAKIANELGNSFASGGAVRGRGNGTSDSIPALLSNGEHVLTAKEVAAFGGQHNVELWRQAALRGRIPDPLDLPTRPRPRGVRRFAAGGPVENVGTIPQVNGSFNDDPLVHLIHNIASGISSKISKIVNKLFSFGGSGRPLGPGGTMSPGQLARGMQFARAQNGKPYIWGGVGPTGYDCSGFQSAIINASMGRNPYSRIGSTSTMPWNNHPGVGRYTIGYYKGSPGHTSGNINGLGVESTGDHVRVGSAANSPLSSMFTGRFHYAKGGPVPALANGGIVTKPTMALIGEAGPEAVIPLRFALGGAVNGGSGGASGPLAGTGISPHLASAIKITSDRFDNLSLAKQLAILRYKIAHTKKGTAAYKTYEKALQQLRKEIEKAAKEKAKERAATIKENKATDAANIAAFKFDQLSPEKQLASLQRQLKHVKKFSAKWVEIREAIRQLTKEIHDTAVESAKAKKEALASFKLAITGDAFNDSLASQITPGADFRGIIGGLVDQAKEMLDAGQITQGAFNKLRSSAIIYLSSLNSVQTRLDAVNQKIEDQTQVLDDAKNKLEEAKAALSEYVDEVKGSITALGTFASMDDGVQRQTDATLALADAQDAYNKTLATYGANSANTLEAQKQLTAAQKTASGAALTGAEIVGNLQANVAKAKSFIANVKKLSALGLGETALREIISMGPIQGAAYAEALVRSSPDVLNSINNAQNELASLGQQFGMNTASWFGLTQNVQSAQLGVNIAQGILSGLQSQQAALEAQMASLGEAMAAAFKKALGIASPSRVFEEMGINTLLGLQKGLVSQVPDTIGVIDGLAGRLDVSTNGGRATTLPPTSSGGGVTINGGVHLTRDVDVDTLTHKLGFWSRQSGRTR